MKNQRGELLVWPGVGPIGSGTGEIGRFEAFLKDKFRVTIQLVEELTRNSGEVDVVIRYFPNEDYSTDTIFRMFCINTGIYPIEMISRTDYPFDSIRKFFK